MPKFLFVYHGGKMPEDPAEVEKEMMRWKTWLEGLGADAVDPGNPVGMSKTIYTDKVTDDGGSNPVSGYGIFNANSIEDAISKGQGCPHLASGGTIEVAEIIELEM